LPYFATSHSAGMLDVDIGVGVGVVAVVGVGLSMSLALACRCRWHCRRRGRCRGRGAERSICDSYCILGQRMNENDNDKKKEASLIHLTN